MRVINFYLGRTVIVSTLIVLSVLIALFTFMTFLSELKFVGQGQYGYGDALMYVLLSVPRMGYQLMPIGALLGCMVGLGFLANQNEIMAIRAAGISKERIVWSVCRASLLLVLLSFILGQWVAPRSEDLGQDIRAQALGEKPALQTASGLWYRDSMSFIHIDSIATNELMHGVDIYELDDRQRLKRHLHARTASNVGSGWTLKEVSVVTLTAEDILISQTEAMPWSTSLEPGVVELIALKPERMSLFALKEYIDFLRGNNLDAARYELTFWRQVWTPVATMILVVLSTPFVFGSIRSVSMGQRILTGSMLGISFYLLDRICGYLGLLYSITPVVSALAPGILFLFLATWMLRRRA